MSGALAARRAGSGRKKPTSGSSMKARASVSETGTASDHAISRARAFAVFAETASDTESLPVELAHRGVETAQRERVHAPVHELGDQTDRRCVFPVLLGHRVQPDAVLVDAGHAVEP